MTSFENTVGETKDMLKQVLEASKSQPSHQQITQELWNSVQPILAAQRELAELQHNSHMELIRVMVEARYKDTQADIRGIKESLAKPTGTSSAPIFENEDQDDAKKGEKDSMRKLDVDPKAKPKGQPKQKLESAKDTSAKSSEKSYTGKKKGIDETLNKQTDEEILAKQKRKDTAESKADVWKQEQEEKLKRENIGTSNRRKSFRNNRPPIATFPKTTASSKKNQTTTTSKPKPSPKKPPQKKQKIASSPPPSSTKPTDLDATKASADVRPSIVETQVVSTTVSQTTGPIHFDPPPSTQPPPTPQRFPSQSTFSPKPPSPLKTPPPPKYAYARKRKFVVLEEEEEK
ncbi:pollen-specific leucine-rich repeat extensin-like protein 1 [Helianthus annuus]|uniref:pollen-specific leucine-rich repeat extensin-like protein 1 n=1 Tax=Helianthus annuus TaxID=4232 RepID=UPI000B908FCA|nr:pollen-specific leucine-rich repeat extensin-like protein 1 [Helianthus annuus]